MYKILSIFMVVVCFSVGAYAQAANPDPPPTKLSIVSTPTASNAEFLERCAKFGEKQRELEAKRAETEKALRDLQYEAAALQDEKTDQVRLTFETETADLLRATADVDYENAICRAQCDKAANKQKADLAAKYQSKWQATFPTSTTKTCANLLPPPK